MSRLPECLIAITVTSFGVALLSALFIEITERSYGGPFAAVVMIASWVFISGAVSLGVTKEQ
jgi:hypothetical protein